MTPETVGYIVAGTQVLNLALLAFFLFRMKAPITVNVSQPPITVNVPPPIAQMPQVLADTLQAVNEKLTPSKPTAGAAELEAAVSDAVAIAELSNVKGPDKFRVALDTVTTRLAAMNLAWDARDTALRIEAEVQRRKGR
jgi:hypothetical protein